VLLNRGTTPQKITVTWEALHYPDTLVARIRDLWRHADLKPTSKAFTANVEGHGVVMITIKP